MKLTKVEEMTLEQKIGHLIVARGYVDEEDKEYILSMVKKGCVGGVQMWHYEGYSDFISRVKENADYPILICADMENGYLGGELRYPPAIGVATSDDPSLAYKLAKATAIEAKKDGVNVAWGPVMDIATQGSLCKIPRCFSDDLDTISKYTFEIIKAFQDEGMIVTAKHFPGGCDIKSDAHMKMEASSMTEEELINKDIILYLDAMNNVDLTGIMTGHILFPKIDDKFTSSLSEKIIGIIRNKGFDGLIMTDSLAMMAIVQNYGEKESLGLAIKAGNDMVLPNYRLSFKDSFEYLMSAYNDGIITDDRLNEAVRHVLEAQQKTLKPASETVVSDELKEAVSEADKKSVCVITKDGVSAALSNTGKKLFIVSCENEYPRLSGDTRELINRKLYSYDNANVILNELLKLFPESDGMIISEFPHYIETENACKKISENDETIFFTFCQTGSYMASDSITERMKNIIDANKDKISTVVHIGNPYEVKKFEDIERIITAPYGGSPEKYIYKILKGELTQRGKLPIKI